MYFSIYNYILNTLDVYFSIYNYILNTLDVYFSIYNNIFIKYIRCAVFPAWKHAFSILL